MKKLIFWLIILGVGAYYGSLYSGEVSSVVDKVKPVISKGVELSKQLSGEVSSDDNLGGVTGIGQLKFSDYGDVTTGWAKFSINAGTSTNSWRNNTGETVYLDLLTLTTTGHASSSFRIVAGTSTISDFALYAQPGKFNSSIIDGFVLATSTGATTTSNYVVPLDGRNQIQGGVVPVKNLEYVSVGLFAAGSSTPSWNFANDCAGPISNGGNFAAANNCESATSSNRGFNINVKLRFNY